MDDNWFCRHDEQHDYFVKKMKWKSFLAPNLRKQWMLFEKAKDMIFQSLEKTYLTSPIIHRLMDALLHHIHTNLSDTTYDK